MRIDPKKFAIYRETVIGMTQAELAAALGMHKGRISAIETSEGGAAMEVENFRKLAILGNSTVEALYNRIGSSEPAARSPAIVGEIAAGGMVEMFSDDSELEHVPMMMPDHPKAFALKIRGDSMEPEYQNGDVIIVEPIAADKIQPGDDLAVWCDGGADEKSCFKRVERIKDGVLFLRPLNKRHKPFEVKCEHVIRAAVEIGLYRPKRRA